MRLVARVEHCGLLRLHGGGVPELCAKEGLPQANGVLGGGETPQSEHRGRVRRRP